MVGCILPEDLLHRAVWFDPGMDWYCFGVIDPLEDWRGNGGLSWKGGAVFDRCYPGLTTEDTKLLEIKNGRLAMAWMLGLEVQYHTTGQAYWRTLLLTWLTRSGNALSFLIT